jgi:hypothetical protein
VNPCVVTSKAPFVSVDTVYELAEISANTSTTPIDPRVKLADFDRHTLPRFPGCSPAKFAIAQLSSFSSQKPEEYWRNMVSVYTRRQLTFPGDKLPALAGLADAFGRNSDLGVYLKGTWSHSLERDIAWISKAGTPSGRLRNEPSWSWASADDGKIQWWPELRLLHWYCVKPIMCTKHTLEASHAHILEFSGLMLRLSLQIHAKRTETEWIDYRLRRVYVTSNRRRYSVPQVHNIHATIPRVPSLPEDAGPERTHLSQTMESSVSSLNWGTFWADRKFWIDEEELQHELQHVFFLPVGITTPFDKTLTWSWGVDSCYVSGIVLRAVDREGPSSDRLCRYERIGWLSYDVQKEHTEWRPEGFRSRFLVV